MDFWRHTNARLFIIRAYRFFKYKEERSRFFREIKIKEKQDKNIQKLDKSCKKLIVFFVPGADRSTGKETISGGVISLVSLCEESRKLKDFHQAETLMCVFPRDFLFLKHENFKNDTDLYRFEQLIGYFRQVQQIILHIPELFVPYWQDLLLRSEMNWLRGMKQVHINVVNANIRLMPTPSEIDKLKHIANLITITAAHSRYCTAEYRRLFNKPLHKFSAWISPEQYVFRPYAEKENVLVVSPDSNPHKELILEKLATIKGLEIIVLKNFSYEKFKEIIGKAKWALTFGEGLDGYILEPIFSGAFGMAAYNEDFFTEDFKSMKGIYPSYESMADSIVSDIFSLDNEQSYQSLQKEQFQICARHYNFEQYRENILKFYLEDYTFK